MSDIEDAGPDQETTKSTGTIDQRMARLEAMMLKMYNTIEGKQEPTKTRAPQSDGLHFGKDTNVRATALRPNPPSKFDGDRSKGRAFLHSVRTYVRLVPELFQIDGNPSEDKAIRFALSYMSDSSAQKWAERHGGEDLPWDSWGDFVAEFKLRFVEENEQDHAIAKLESREYYQGRRDVFAYTNDFEDLWDDTGFEDDLVKVAKYRSGLDPSINHAITTSSHPALNDYAGWRKRAYQQYDTKMRAKSIFGSHTPATQEFYKTATVLQNKRRQQAPAPAPAAPAPAASGVVPMEVDRTPAPGPRPRLCFRCGLPGHIAQNCPTQQDVRAIDILDEVQNQLGADLLEELFARVESLRVVEEHTSEAEEQGFRLRGE
uniref:Gag protein n=1 Tax=Mycena chlorophos TaxID=658473 RepID=A0ABQ0LCZ4_MYCCL|nr:gag protein [Mycena chlorophos]